MRPATLGLLLLATALGGCLAQPHTYLDFHLVDPENLPTPPPAGAILTLDEARTRREAPALAAALDDAVEHGRSGLREQREVERALRYVEEISGQPPTSMHLHWRAAQVEMLVAVT